MYKVSAFSKLYSPKILSSRKRHAARVQKGVAGHRSDYRSEIYRSVAEKYSFFFEKEANLLLCVLIPHLSQYCHCRPRKKCVPKITTNR